MADRWSQLITQLHKVADQAWAGRGPAATKLVVRPPVTQEQLKEAEAALGHTIPVEYRALLSVTNGLEMNLTPGLGWVELAEAPAGLAQLHGEVGRLLETAEDEPGPLPYTVIGHTSDTLWYICLSHADGSIWMGDHDYSPAEFLTPGRAGRRAADSVEHFLTQLIRHQGEWWWEAS